MSVVRILVIDDEPSVIMLCQRALEGQGFEVKGVLSGEEGLQLLKVGRVANSPYDMVLLDIRLPDRDGLELLSMLREMDPELAVAIITGYATMEVAIRALKLGAQDFLMKPFTPGELVISMQKILEKKRLIQENLRLKAQLPILEVSKALMSEVNLERLTQLALETVQKTLEADRVSLMLLDEEHQELSITAALGLPDEAMTTTRVKVGQGLAGLVAQKKEPVLLPEGARDAPAIQALLTRSEIGPAICLPLIAKDRVLGVLNASRLLGGAPFHQDDVDLLSILGGQIAVALVNARLFEQAQREIVERKRAEEALRRHAEQLEALRQVGLEIAAQLDLDALLQSIVSRAIELLRGSSGGLYLYRSELLEWAVSIGPNLAPIGSALHRGEGLAGKIWEADQPLIVDDYRHWEGRAAVYEGYPFSAIVGVPVRWGGAFLGVLEVLADPPRTFSSQDAEMLGLLAAQAAIAIENVRLYGSLSHQREQLRALATRLAEAEEAERRRLARELHDQVGQNLTALGINLNIVRSHLIPHPSPDRGGAGGEGERMTNLIRSRLDDSLALVEQTTERIRDVMAELRPPVLDDYGLMAALRWYGAQFASRMGFAVTVEGEEIVPRLATSVENALFRIAQEALTNVSKHAQATQATVTMEVDGETVHLVIADDGIGFDPARLPETEGRRGWGLLSMAERAEAVGGRCRVESRLGEGTRVTVEVAR